MNSVQKSHWAHMSISPRTGTKGQQRLQSLKYYNVLKCESRFISGSTLPKIHIIFKKNAQIKVVEYLQRVIHKLPQQIHILSGKIQKKKK